MCERGRERENSVSKLHQSSSTVGGGMYSQESSIKSGGGEKSLKYVSNEEEAEVERVGERVCERMY